ncbi:MAG TPA: 30S ribosomal protein S2 [Saprospiraceae bacterium]|nr:30S ribosomal protein S2 [Saprospiraceae bacterium]
MQSPTRQELLNAGVHFGHQKRKWNPKMKPYIFMENKGIHVIDLNKTSAEMEKAGKAMTQLVKSGKKILFVGTKKQGKLIVAEAAKKVNMPYVSERWLGGMLTNFATIKRSVKKMQNIEKMLADKALTSITKKERLTLDRERVKLEKVLGGIAGINRIPHAIFIVDIHHEHLALAEAKKLKMITFGVVDTNSDPGKVDFVIPGNDDSSKSIQLYMDYFVKCIQEGQAARAKSRDAKKD